jgi:hypothetical protein
MSEIIQTDAKDFRVMQTLESGRQDAKWGQQDHSQAKWLAIIGEELGEACKAMLQDHPVEYAEELVQVAASCQAAYESLMRQSRANP